MSVMFVDNHLCTLIKLLLSILKSSIFIMWEFCFRSKMFFHYCWDFN